jgi:shikimate dehydrogenase
VTAGTVLVTSRSFGGGTARCEQRLIDAGLTVVRGSIAHDLDELRPVLAETVAWIAGTGPVTREHLEAAPALRLIARYGVGTDNVDLDAASRHGVAVTNTPGANSEAVADLTIGLLLAALRGIVPAAREGTARPGAPHRGRDLGALTVGIAGFGRIGRAVARRLEGFGTRVLFHDPFVEGGVPSLDDLAERCDAVTLHAPGGSLRIGAEWLARARPGLVLVNTARADLVDERAVAASMLDGRLGAYAADVLGGDGLRAPELADRVLITPHIGSHTVEAVDRMSESTTDAVLKALGLGALGREALGETIMEFVGVSTGRSSIMRVFPAWAEVLGLRDARLVGHDVPLNASAERYRELVAGIGDDPRRRGALVTSHKIALYRAAADLFDEIDRFAELCGEISSISKRGDRLIGHAKDPITAGLAIEEFLAPDHFARTGGRVLCLGAGGAGTAIAWYLAQRPDPPAEILCTDVDEERLRALHGVLEAGPGRAKLTTRLVDGDGAADRLLRGLPPGSLVVNATGLGKDRPGSPLGPDAIFPERALVWELNYRGELDFLHGARAQAERRGLTVVDGWRYFIHGWSQVIAEVFGIPMEPETVNELSRVAAEVR